MQACFNNASKVSVDGICLLQYAIPFLSFVMNVLTTPIDVQAGQSVAVGFFSGGYFIFIEDFSTKDHTRTVRFTKMA